MADLDKKIKIFGLAPGSIVDGPGLRFSVFVQGCAHHCDGCHNLESQSHNGGKEMSIGQILDAYEHSQSSGAVTLSGGEPFDQSEAVCELAAAIKEKNTNVWCYTGYVFETLLDIVNAKDGDGQNKYCNKEHSQFVKKMLMNIDVLVDGPFMIEKKSYDALYRGSTNQRLIDMPKTLQQKNIVLWEDHFNVPERPPSW